jgi:hypothetical protein
MPGRKLPIGWLALLGALALGAGAAVSGCGSSNSQADARDRATTTSCDWFQMCGQIGAGKRYETRDTCNVQVRASWDQAWPVASCDGKIDENQLGICLAAIQSTLCGNGLDVLNTLVNKCPEAKICGGANPDGG